MRYGTGAIAVALAALGLAGPATAGVELHVSPKGDDGAAGTKTAPFRTMQQARDAVRRLKARGPLATGGVTVWLRGGQYPLAETVELTEADGGTAEAPVVYRAAAGEQPRLLGGRMVRPGDLRPVTDPAILRRLDPAARGKVVYLDTKALGIRHAGRWPDLFHGGGGIIELFFDGRRMPLARWPNEGYTTMKVVLDSGVWAGPQRRGGTFVYRDDRPARWREAVKDGLWLKGFWRVPWQPETVRVASIDPAPGTITHAAPVGGGLGSKYTPEVDGTRKGSGKEPWYALNVLEELDRPGEWCLHFPTGRLYFWPPESPASARVMISDTDTPLLRLKGAAFVTVRGLTFEGGLGDGVQIDGGRDCLLAGCVLRNLGQTGVVVRGGERHGVQSCDLYELGGGGIYLGGGDRAKLIPAGHYAVNNDIHHFGRVQTTYAPGIKLGAYGFTAVGCRAAHNRIHDAPHAAVLYGGNDNVLEYNHVYRVALDSDDVGAFYTWHDWTSRGNVLRHNFVHDSPRCNAFYLDDGDSGDTVFGNVVYRAGCGPFVGGGHDNLIRNNLVIECKRGIHIDDRGVARGYNLSHRKLVGGVQAVRHTQPPWSRRYPEMLKILEHHPDWPTGTVIETNVTVRCERALNVGGRKEHYAFTRIGTNLDLPEGEAGFVDAASLNFALRADSPVYRKLADFKPIQFERIGLRTDEYRTALPAPGRGGAETGEPTP